MRFTGVFAFTTLAATALASPIAQSYSEGSGVDAASPVGGAGDESAEKLPAGESALPSDAAPEEVTSIIAQQAAPTGSGLPAVGGDDEGDDSEEGSSPVQSCAEVIELLEKHVESVKSQTGDIGMFTSRSVSTHCRHPLTTT